MNTKVWKTLIVGVLLVISLAGSVVAQEADAPGEAITDFYNWYLNYFWSGDTFRSPLADGAYRDSEYLTQDFIERIDERLAEAGIAGLGYDLFLCAQDIPDRYEYEVIRVQPGELQVLLREYFGAQHANNLTLMLNNSADGWQIDDVVCGDTFTPAGVTEDFYAWYLAQWQQAQDVETDSAPLTEDLDQEYPFLTISLRAIVDEAIANDAMGGDDPFVCAQEMPQSVWAYDVALTDNTTTVLAQAFFPGNNIPQNVTVSLEAVNGQWTIAQITCGVSPETMATLLYQQYADQVRYNRANDIDMNVLSNPGPLWSSNVSTELLERLGLGSMTDQELTVDPVLCAQDIPDRFVAESATLAETTATIQISGEVPNDSGSTTSQPLASVTMELSEGQWMLTDITCAQ